MPGNVPPPPARLASAARLVLLIAGFVCLGFLAFAVRRFADAWDGPAIATCALLGTTAGGLIAAAVLLQPAARVVTAVFCALLTLLAVGTEAALSFRRIWQQVRVQEAISTRTGTAFDRRTTSEVIAESRRTGTPVGPAIVPGMLLQASAGNVDRRLAWTAAFLPVSGISQHQSVLACNEDGQFHAYRSDEHGFANPPGNWTADAVDIALIGDSYTHGYCVDFEDSYAAQLRKLGLKALNLGSGGSGPLVELATLTEFAAPLRPRIVVWQYCENDLSDLASERQQPLLRRYFETGFSQALISRQPEVDRALVEWTERLPHGRAVMGTGTAFSWRQTATLYQLRELTWSLFRGPEDGTREQVQLFGEILKAARDRVQAWGGQMVFVYVPGWERYYQPAALAGRDTRDGVISAVHALGLPVVDLDATVRAYSPREQLFARQELSPAHFSALGYRLMAGDLAAAIRRRY